VRPTSSRSRHRLATLVVAMGLLTMATACGQKPGVHDAAKDELPDIIVEGGAAGAGGPAVASDDGAAAGDDSAAGAGTGGASGTTGGSTGGAAVKLTMTGKDKTGVSADVIRLGVHAPVTGAAPLPSASFEKASDMYWRYVTEIKHEKVLGRSKVTVSFKDDKYTPNTAIQACRELGSSSFLVAGAGGTDQIQACAQYANQAKLPYFSAGVTEVGLKGLDYYFAASMSYPQQTELLAQYVKKNFSGQKVGAIITDTPNFDDAAAAWDAAVKKQGLPYTKTLRHPKGNSSWITSYASEMKSAGVQVLFILSSPVDYIQFAQQSSTQGFKPQYVGVGISKGLNAVLSAGCPDVDKGIFFSPFPGLDWARQHLPEFFETGKRLGVPADDVALALWGISSVEHQAFLRYQQVYGSTDLTREDFTKMLETQSGIQTKTNPQLSYTPSNHFGADQVHVLQADCAAGQYKTLATFASGF
jgi:ABC-type branched-subunit amino acid transport system substrate-binding protein